MEFSEVASSPDLPKLETELLKKWREENLFKQSIEKQKGEKLWMFYEGPPTANGAPGIHHIWARVFKDLYPRYWSMRGRHTPRIAGWDCHGLPVEIEVERELGFSTKAEVEAYGIEAFNKKCRESVQRYVGEWEELTERMGMWIDTENAYWTMSNDFIESIWWLFGEIWDKGLIYEGSKVVPYCGRCGTALSSHEVAQGYSDVTDDAVFVRFEMKDKSYNLLAWTTTPWTLISNVALAVNPSIEYVEAEMADGSPNIVFAKELAESILGLLDSDSKNSLKSEEVKNTNQDESLNGDEVENKSSIKNEPLQPIGKIIREVPASELIGQHYTPPFNYLTPDGKAHEVLSADFVSTEEGSGIVHMASSFGEIDREVCEANGISTFNPVNAEGKFNDEVGTHSGKFVIDANVGLINELGDKVYKQEKYQHSYPHCWRCDTALIYWAKPTWFAATSQIRDTMLEENAKVGWHPEHIKDGRFGTWLKENVDWALSRDRFWGTPIPIWRCDTCDETTAIKSVEELSSLADKELSDLDLHRPYIDEISFACTIKKDKEKCSGQMTRVPSVLDAWFDSGSVPLAQFHYPFSSEEPKKKNFPADFVCEAIDQTRGWFYSMLALNSLAFGETPYKNVVCLAHILDKKGQKMSKSKGNVIAPMPLLHELGADSIRWYFLAEGSPWTPRRMSVDEVVRSTRQTLLTLWNVYSFFTTYANIDGWKPEDSSPSDAKEPLDLWLRSRLRSTIEVVTDGLADFDAFTSAKAIQTFIDDLSNWYVRRSRTRFWEGNDLAAHAVLYEALLETSKLLAPFCPFLSDEIHRNLSGGKSVHLADWTDLKVKTKKRAGNLPLKNSELEREVETVRKLATLGRAARTEANIKVRKPLKRALVLYPVQSEGERLSDAALSNLAEELNVKSVEHAPDLEELFSYRVSPNFKTLGPRLGKKMKATGEHIKSLQGKDLKKEFASSGAFSLTLEGETISLEPEDVEITAISHEDLAVSEDAGYSIALDLELTPELLAEGAVRELIRQVNEHRKNIELKIEDRIKLEVSAAGWIYEAINSHKEFLAKEVLATDVLITNISGGAFDNFSNSTVDKNSEDTPRGARIMEKSSFSTAGKNSQDAPRDESNALVGAGTAMIELTEDGDRVIIKVEKV